MSVLLLAEYEEQPRAFLVADLMVNEWMMNDYRDMILVVSSMLDEEGVDVLEND